MHAQEGVIDGLWDGCTGFAKEIHEIAQGLGNDKAAMNEVFFTGACKDLLAEFKIALKTSARKLET
jgi:hypothetical protein